MNEHDHSVITKERGYSMPFGLRWDFNRKWLATLLAINFFVWAFLVGSISNGLIFGLLFSLMSAVFLLIFVMMQIKVGGVRMSFLTYIFRRADFDTGEQKLINNLPKARKSSRKWSKRLGKFKFVSYPQGNNEDFGLIHDLKEGTISIVFHIKGSSNLLIDEDGRSKLQTSFGKLLDRVSKGNFYRFSFRVQNLEGEAVDFGQMSNDVVADLNLDRTNSPNAERLMESLNDFAGKVPVKQITFILTIRIKDFDGLKGSAEDHLVSEASEFYSDLGLGNPLASNPIGARDIHCLSYNEAILFQRVALDPVGSDDVRKAVMSMSFDQAFHESYAWPDPIWETDHALVGSTYHKAGYFNKLDEDGIPFDHLWRIISSDIKGSFTVVFEVVPKNVAKRKAKYNRNTARNVMNESSGSVNEDQLREVQKADNLLHSMSYTDSTTSRMVIFFDITGNNPQIVEEHMSVLRSRAANLDMSVEPFNLHHWDGVEVLLSTGRGLRSTYRKGLAKYIR